MHLKSSADCLPTFSAPSPNGSTRLTPGKTRCIAGMCDCSKSLLHNENKRALASSGRRGEQARRLHLGVADLPSQYHNTHTCQPACGNSCPHHARLSRKYLPRYSESAGCPAFVTLRPPGSVKPVGSGAPMAAKESDNRTTAPSNNERRVCKQ